MWTGTIFLNTVLTRNVIKKVLKIARDLPS